MQWVQSLQNAAARLVTGARQFLRCRREDRMSCSFGCVDKVQQGKDKRKRAREAENNARAERSAETMAKQKCIRGTHTLSRLKEDEEVGQDSSAASEDCSDEEFAYRATPTKPGPSHITHARIKKRGSSEVLDASLTTTWDREGLSNRQRQRHHEDRIAVIASGVDFKELLGVKVATDGSGSHSHCDLIWCTLVHYWL